MKTIYKVLTMVLDAHGGGFPIDTTNPDDQYLWTDDLKKAKEIYKNAHLLNYCDFGKPIKQIVVAKISERKYKKCLKQDGGTKSIDYAIDWDWEEIKEGRLTVKKGATNGN